jgi:hypothetical protein
VHSRPKAIWQLIKTAGLTVYERTSDSLHLLNGRILKKKQVGEIADTVLSKMSESIREKDESFEDYLRRSQPAKR